jgi:hypothetical protein
MSLRDEFEPHRLSPDGMHPDAAACGKAWDRETSDDAKLEGMIALADEWLRLCGRSKDIDRTKPNSYSLKSICSRWHGKHGFGPMILNGCLLMAAHRLGFKMEQQTPRYVEKLKRFDANAFINISTWPYDGNERPWGGQRREIRT